MIGRAFDRDEHDRRVNLMLHGAFDSPVFACWDLHTEVSTTEEIQCSPKSDEEDDMKTHSV